MRDEVILEDVRRPMKFERRESVKVGPGLRGISPLARRIVLFNLAGLALLLAGVLFFNQFKSGLIDLRVKALLVQGQIISIAIVENAVDQPRENRYNVELANETLRKLIRPANVRAQIYDRSGRLTGDTWDLLPDTIPIETLQLPPPDPYSLGAVSAGFKDAYDAVVTFVSGDVPVYGNKPKAGITQDPEVYVALGGKVSSGIRANSRGQLIVSVAVPIQRSRAVLGALVISTERGDIDDIVEAERFSIIRVFLVAMAVSLALSIVLAGAIARPLRRMAEAAESGGAEEAAPLNPERIRIPDLTERRDEIGYLSGALRRMTDALYQRIDAIETFAADVAHEIKNPLTSLRSAVETMRFAKTDENRERLLQVIENDVDRLDRLVTDISNASRLDAELVREERESFDVSALVNAMVEFFEHRAELRQAVLKVDLPKLPVHIRGLESRLAQVLQNLIDNGLSFTPPDGVLSTRLTDHGKYVRIEVQDQGPGVPEENLSSIFQRFYTERPVTEEFGNHSGLGLNIAKQIVEAHGGAIWAENYRRPRAKIGDPPTGARFIVELPK